MKTIPVYTVGELRPEDDSVVLLWKDTEDHPILDSPVRVKIEYTWSNGQGDQICYNGEDAIEGYEITLLADAGYTSYELCNSNLWSPVVDLSKDE